MLQNLFLEKVIKFPTLLTLQLSENFSESISAFKASKYLQKLLGQETHNKYYEIKKVVVERSPKSLGNTIKTGEIIFHHEVTNQVLWNKF